MNLNEKLKAVSTRADFVAFVRALEADWREQPQEWENPTLGSYLEALAAWVEDSENRLESTELTWRVLGEIMIAARIYE